MRSSSWYLLIVAALVANLGLLASADYPAPDAFSSDSFWNTPLGADATVHPNSDAIIDFLANDNDLNGCITLAGYPGNSWGMPVFVADGSDPVYNVSSSGWSSPEFESLRIPAGAVAADTSDGEMVVYDTTKGIVAQLSKGTYNAGSDTWSVSGGSVFYLDSNGLVGSLPESNESRNSGSFRGYPGSVAMVHYDDIAAGKLDNVVKIGVNNANGGHVFPMIGSDGDTNNPNAPLEGMIIRIKPDVNLAALGLSGQALTIAKGLQEYGMMVGDNTGGAIVLKLEDTIASGRGDLWDLDRTSLCSIQPEHLEVVGDGGTPPTPTLPPSGFTDVPVGHAFEAEITWLAGQEITQGCSEERFCPSNKVTRGEMAVFISRALNLPGAPSASFDDVDGHPYEDHIDRLASAGITEGCAANLFCPNTPITRAQMAAFVTRAFDLSTSGTGAFNDVAGHPFEAEINALAAAGITNGCSAVNFCPNAHVTREQMAAFLERAIAG